MRIMVALALVGMSIAGARDAQASGEAAAAACAAHGNLQYVCGPANAEDFVAVPGGAEILVSGFAMPGTPAGKLYSVDTGSMSFKELKPTVPTDPVHEYAACPGPIDLAKFKPHGVALRQGTGNSHELYVVNHGTRESIEIFAVDSARHPSTLKWIGCAVLPAGASGNGVAPLPHGGFVATQFYDDTKGPWMAQLEGLQKTGAVFVWHPDSGFKELEAGRATGDNGIEATADGKWIFVNLWPERRVLRISSDGSQPTASIALDFMPDNIHLAPDGSMLVGGHIADMHILANAKRADFPVDWAVARIDPKSLTVAYLLWEKGHPEFQGITGALEANGKLWLSTYHGDRLASIPLPLRPLHN